MAFRGRSPNTRGLVLELAAVTELPDWALDETVRAAAIEAMSDDSPSWDEFVASVRDDGVLRARLERAGFLDGSVPVWQPTEAHLDVRALWAGTSMLAARGAIPPLKGTLLTLQTYDVCDFVLDVTDPDALHDFAVRLLVDLDDEGGLLDALVSERGRGLPRGLRSLLGVRVLEQTVVGSLDRFPQWSTAPRPPTFEDSERTFLTIEVAAPFPVAPEKRGRFFDSHA